MSAETLPTPSKLLVVVSVLNIGVWLYLVSETFAAFVCYAGSFIFWFALFLGPIPVAVAIQQYRGTFRHVPSAAIFCSGIVFQVGCLTSFAFVIMSIVMMTLGEMNELWLFIIPCLAISLILFGTARLNLIWGRKIDTIFSSPSPPQKRRGYSLQEPLLFVGVLAVMCGVVGRRINSTVSISARYAEHVSASAVSFKLPIDATDVSYCRTFSGRTAYEFTCRESSFRDWVNEHVDTAGGIRLSEIRPPYHTVWRYCSLTPRLKGANSVSINNGLFCVGTIGEKSFIVAYDRETGRAYYYAQ